MRTVVLCVLTLSLFAPAALGFSYSNETAASGIVHKTAGEIHDPDTRSATWPGFPEIFGPGACFADFDLDTDQDLFLVNQRYNPENPQYGPWAEAEDPRDAMWRNNGDGTFTDVTELTGIDGRGFGYACSTADYDGDGDFDLFVSNFGDNQLLRNEGGMVFTDVTAAAQIQDAEQCRDDPCTSMGSAWADYDMDGDLDLYVTNYVTTALDDTHRGPEEHVAQENQLLRNNGDGTFTDVARALGVEGEALDIWGSKSFQPMWTDVDRDGDLDLYVTNDLTPNDFYLNNGDGTFTEMSNSTNLADPRQGMGLTTGDYNGDCYPDFFFTHYSGALNGLYVNNRNLTWTDEGDVGGHMDSLDWVGWGANFMDVDLDGDEDLLIVNGHTEWIMAWLRPSIGYEHPIQLLLNVPDTTGTVGSGRTWISANSSTAGPSIGEEWVGRGLAVADLGFDGVLDFVVTPNGNESASLHRGTGADHPFLRVELAGTGKNLYGIGAKVAIEVAGVRQCREVYAGSGFLGQNELALTFGLGDHAMVDLIEVIWPDGTVTLLHNVPGDNAIRIDQATGTYVTDTLAPVTRLVGQVEGHMGWWNQSVLVRLETVDRAVRNASGVASVEHHFGDDAWAPYMGQSYWYPDEGADFIHVRSVDHSGNEEPPTPLLVGRDFTPPVPLHAVLGLSGDDGWMVGPSVGFELAGEDAGSGVGLIEYRVDGGPWTTYEDRTMLPDDGGVYEVTYRVWDVARNKADPVSFIVKHDPDPPSVAILRPAARTVYLYGDALHEYGAGPALSWLLSPPAMLPGLEPRFRVTTAASDDVSGLRYVSIHRNGVEVANETSAPQWWWDAWTEAAGQHQLTATARDHAGNVATAYRSVMVAAAGGAPAAHDAGDDPAWVGGMPVALALLGLVGVVRRRPHLR